MKSARVPGVPLGVAQPTTSLEDCINKSPKTVMAPVPIRLRRWLLIDVETPRAPKPPAGFACVLLLHRSAIGLGPWSAPGGSTNTFYCARLRIRRTSNIPPAMKTPRQSISTS